MFETAVRRPQKIHVKRALLIIGAGVLLLLALPILFALLHSDETRVAHLFAAESPEIILRLEITDQTSRVLWAIENAGTATVRLLDYGSVPAGFRQLYPADGPPRALGPKEAFLLTYSVPDRGWARIGVRKAKAEGFLYGLAASGNGCPDTGCNEVFLFQGWSNAAPGSP